MLLINILENFDELLLEIATIQVKARAHVRPHLAFFKKYHSGVFLWQNHNTDSYCKNTAVVEICLLISEWELSL